MVYDCEQAGVLRETGTANGGTAAGVRGWDGVRLRACRRAEKAEKAGDLGTATGIAGLGLCKIASMPACEKAEKTGDCRACEHAWSKGSKGSKAKARRQALHGPRRGDV